VPDSEPNMKAGAEARDPIAKRGAIAANRLETKLDERARQLSAANLFLDSVIDNIPNMIFVKDAKDLRFIRINAAGEDLIGVSREEMIGKNDFDFFPADQAQLFTDGDRETLRNRRLVDIPEETIQTRHKGTRILHTRKIPILDTNGEPGFLLGISEDITAAKGVQQALQLAQEEADRANRAKSQFLATMSHELRTPLNAILGFSELLSDDVTGHLDDATRRRFLDQIHTSGQHLLQLINDILDLSKVEAGQMDLHVLAVDLSQVVDDVRATVEPLARQRGVALDVELETGLQLIADPAKLKQMLLNLVSNAIKFNPSEGRVRIHARRIDSWVEIAVSDTGIGIAEEDLDGLFAEFHQLDAGYGRQQEGTGLGLALTKRFAELHGGFVTVESAIGSGSTFTLHLPLDATHQTAQTASEPGAVVATDPSHPLVLVVDDNRQAAEILGRHLKAGGFRMEVARTGPEALAKARRLKPVAVTLDILLPEIDGWEVLARLKADSATRDIPVVVISVVDDPTLGRALGAIDYFVKPVDGKALLSRLDQYTFAAKVKSEPVHVLVVDDEQANLDLLEGLLKPAGFEVRTANGGQKGIEMARSEMPDLILLDLLMPDVSGFDVVEALGTEEKTRSIPIMVLTAKVLTESEKSTLNRQVAAIFQRKSVAGAELTDWLRAIVAKRREL
jgi:PAS domain S-box-containing protein